MMRGFTFTAYDLRRIIGICRRTTDTYHLYVVIMTIDVTNVFNVYVVVSFVIVRLDFAEHSDLTRLRFFTTCSSLEAAFCKKGPQMRKFFRIALTVIQGT